MKTKNIKSANKYYKVIIAIALIVITLVMVSTATYSWYQVQFKEVFVLDVDASGILYLYLEVPVDKIGEGEERKLVPAIAKPYAVLNGMYMNPLVEYNAEDDNPSYIEKVAQPYTYSGDFTLFQGTGVSTNLQYKLSMKSGTDASALTFSRNEFVYTDVSFEYKTTIPDESTEEDPDDFINITVDPLISQSEDCASGLLNITDSQKVFFTITIVFANVDELVDTNIMSQPFIWCELALVAEVAG